MRSRPRRSQINYVFFDSELRERPFNLKGGVMVFFLKNILIPNVAEKNILILVEEKKKSDSEFLSYNLLMLNFGEKNKYSNYCVVRKKKF